MTISEFLPVSAIWTHREAPMSLAEAGPAARIKGSVDRPGEFVLQLRSAGEVVSVRLGHEVLAELHRQASLVHRSGQEAEHG